MTHPAFPHGYSGSRGSFLCSAATPCSLPDVLHGPAVCLSPRPSLWHSAASPLRRPCAPVAPRRPAPCRTRHPATPPQAPAGPARPLQCPRRVLREGPGNIGRFQSGRLSRRLPRVQHRRFRRGLGLGAASATAMRCLERCTAMSASLRALATSPSSDWEPDEEDSRWDETSARDMRAARTARAASSDIRRVHVSAAFNQLTRPRLRRKLHV
jgi:hypothetical protein